MEIFTLEISDGSVGMPSNTTASRVDPDVLISARQAISKLREGEKSAIVDQSGESPLHVSFTAPDWISEDALFVSAEDSAFLAVVTIRSGQSEMFPLVQSLVRGTIRPQTANDPVFKVGLKIVHRHAPAMVVVSRHTRQISSKELQAGTELCHALAAAILSETEPIISRQQMAKAA